MSKNADLATKLGAVGKSQAAATSEAKKLSAVVAQDKSEKPLANTLQTGESIMNATKTPAQRAAALSAFVASMNKSRGSGSISLGEEGLDRTMVRIPTGSPELDAALNGGFPAGRIVEIMGPESSGKSTICWTTIAGIQARGGSVMYIDTEHALDRDYLEKLGVKMDLMAVSQPASAEEALGILEDAVRAQIFDMIVLDSVAALSSEKEIEKDIREQTVALVARLMSAHLRKITSEVANSKTLLVFINQIRSKIGGYGNPETTTGGNALKYFCSVRLDTRRIEYVKDGEEVIGMKQITKVVKNKTGRPFQKAESTLIYGVGFDQVAGVYEEALAKGVLTKSGGSHFLGGDKANKLASKRAEMVERLRNEPELLQQIKDLNFKAKVLPKETTES